MICINLPAKRPQTIRLNNQIRLTRFQNVRQEWVILGEQPSTSLELLVVQVVRVVERGKADGPQAEIIEVLDRLASWKLEKSEINRSVCEQNLFEIILSNRAVMKTHRRTPARTECRSWSAWRLKTYKCRWHHRWKSAFRWCQNTFWLLSLIRFWFNVLIRFRSSGEQTKFDRFDPLLMVLAGYSTIEHTKWKRPSVPVPDESVLHCRTFLISNTIFQFKN